MACLYDGNVVQMENLRLSLVWKSVNTICMKDLVVLLIITMRWWWWWWWICYMHSIFPHKSTWSEQLIRSLLFILIAKIYWQCNCFAIHNLQAFITREHITRNSLTRELECICVRVWVSVNVTTSTTAMTATQTQFTQFTKVDVAQSCWGKASKLIIIK